MIEKLEYDKDNSNNNTITIGSGDSQVTVTLSEVKDVFKVKGSGDDAKTYVVTKQTDGTYKIEEDKKKS